MPSKATAATIAIVVLAALYQVLLRDILFVLLGVGRVVQPIEEFPYTCRRLRHPLLEACEHIQLDHDARLLFAACSSPTARLQWCPSITALNISGRVKGGDHVAVLDIDKPGKDGLYGLRKLKTAGYSGANGDGSLDLHGFDIEIVDSSTRRLWMINHRPPVDPETNAYLDAMKVGANSTVDVFEYVLGKNEMVHIKTIAHSSIETPNSIVTTCDGGFIVTNDKTGKVGLMRELQPIIGGGSVAYCDSASTCNIAASKGFFHPNGIVKEPDNFYYIENTYSGIINVMELLPNRTLVDRDIIQVGVPGDNFYIDPDGNIYLAAFPKGYKTMMGMAKADPYTDFSPPAVLRIRKRTSGNNQASGNTSGNYEIEKIFEDRDRKAMGFATSAVVDKTNGKLFLSGVQTPYITVCDPK